MQTSRPFDDPAVASAFAAFPDAVRPALYAVREMVFSLAAETPEVGRIEETLKWGQPAYLTPETRSGSTLRLGAGGDGRAAVYVHCQTTILSDVAHVFPDGFDYEKTRAAHFDPASLPEVPLRHLIRTALTYHLAKRR